MIILGTNSIKETGFNVANSCNFEDGSLHKSVSSPSATFTISVWVKLSNQYVATSSIGQRYFWTGGGAGGASGAKWNSGNTGYLDFYNEGTGHVDDGTDRNYRDPSAWYHWVWKNSSGTGTLYVNGVQQGSTFSMGPLIGSGGPDVINIGRYGADTVYAPMTLAEFVYLDGTAATPTSFGEVDDDSGIWKPKDVSGLTFGTNGFHLDFSNASALGTDANGGTTLTTTATLSQLTDTPTNSFATLNSLINFNSGVFTKGNLAITSGDDTVSTIGLTSGRWDGEAQRTNTTNEAHIGIGGSKGFFSATSGVSSGDRIYVRGGATFVSAVSNLGILTFGSNGGTPATISNGDVIGFYLDLESSTKNITVKKNDGATPIIDIDLTYSGEEPIFPFCRMNSGCASSWNFGNPIAALSSANADANGFGSFEFNPTKGGVDYFAICTKNLAEYG